VPGGSPVDSEPNGTSGGVLKKYVEYNRVDGHGTRARWREL